MLEEWRDKSLSLPSRLELCTEILSKVTRLVRQTPDGQIWWKNYRNAVKDLMDSWFVRVKEELSSRADFSSNQTSVQQTGRSLFERGLSVPLLDATGRRNIAALGFAVGKPKSTERRQDLDQKWAMNLPDLHLVHAHEPRYYGQWMKKLERLVEGQSYFLAVVSELEGKEYLEALLAQCPDTRNLIAGLEYNDIKEKLILRCGLWIQLRESEDQTQNNWRLFPTDRIATKNFEGMNIGVNETGGINFAWLKDDGTSKTIQLTAKYAIPKREEEIRYIHFTEAGIDITDAQGKPFRQSRQSNAAPLLATFPKSSLAGRINGENLFDLWKAVRTHLGQVFDDPTAAPTITHYSFQKKDGLKYVAHAARGETPTQNRPPRPEDALWVMDTFINQRFPHGETFRTISKRSVSPLQKIIRRSWLFCKAQDMLVTLGHQSCLGHSTEGTLPSIAKVCRPCEAVGKKAEIIVRPQQQLRRRRSISSDLLVALILQCFLHPKHPESPGQSNQKRRLTTRSAKLDRLLVATPPPPRRRRPRRKLTRSPSVHFSRSLETQNRRPKVLLAVERLLHQQRHTVPVSKSENPGPTQASHKSRSSLHRSLVRSKLLSRAIAEPQVKTLQVKTPQVKTGITHNNMALRLATTVINQGILPRTVLITIQGEIGEQGMQVNRR